MARKSPGASRAVLYDSEAIGERLNCTAGHAGKLCRQGRIRGAKRKLVTGKDGHRRWTWYAPAKRVHEYSVLQNRWANRLKPATPAKRKR